MPYKPTTKFNKDIENIVNRLKDLLNQFETFDKQLATMSVKSEDMSLSEMRDVSATMTAVVDDLKMMYVKMQVIGNRMTEWDSAMNQVVLKRESIERMRGLRMNWSQVNPAFIIGQVDEQMTQRYLMARPNEQREPLQVAMVTEMDNLSTHVSQTQLNNQ